MCYLYVGYKFPNPLCKSIQMRCDVCVKSDGAAACMLMCVCIYIFALLAKINTIDPVPQKKHIHTTRPPNVGDHTSEWYTRIHSLMINSRHSTKNHTQTHNIGRHRMQSLYGAFGKRLSFLRCVLKVCIFHSQGVWVCVYMEFIVDLI